MRYLSVIAFLAAVLSTGCAAAATTQPTTGAAGALTMKQVRTALLKSGAAHIQTQTIASWPAVVASYKRAGNCACASAGVTVAVISSEQLASEMLPGARDGAQRAVEENGQDRQWQVQEVFQHGNLLIMYVGDQRHLDLVKRTLRGI